MFKKMILTALGEASALFMSQGNIPAGQIIMPTEDLNKIANKLNDNILANLSGENE